MKENTKSTACILCHINCGITVDIEERQITKVKGDLDNLKSKGYLCQKAGRLNYYQNHKDRLTNPLRKKSDGKFEKIDWNTAISEVAEKLKHIKETYGSHAIAYYGGGGQGNHMNQSYSSSLRHSLGTPYIYTALAQEKTGDFWVNGKLFGKQSCHITEDIENADYVLFIGTNPWQAHGFLQARKVLKELAKDTERTMVVIDPRRTKTAALADIHLQVKPGTDAYLLSAILAIIIQEGLEDTHFLKTHTLGFDAIRQQFTEIPIEDYAIKAGIDLAVLQTIAREFATAKRACVRVDLGIQQSIHSTLNSYLEKLLFLITGNFGKKGGNSLHTQFATIIGHSKTPKEGGLSTKVTKMHAIANFFPPNILPLEIDTEHKDRVRAVIVDSSNPILTAADTNAYKKAFKKLDLLLVIDVANTETARMADYVLPAKSQFEKWEATFFTMEFPTNYFQVRKPILKAEGNTLTEAEIYRRLLVAMKAVPNRFPILEKVAKFHFRFPSLGIFPIALQLLLLLKPSYKKNILIVLYATIGKALGKGAQNMAMLWGVSHRYAKKYRKAVLRTGLKGKGLALGEALFDRILKSKSAIIISEHTYEEVWELVEHPNRKIHLEIPEMTTAIQELRQEKEMISDAFPFILAAGERRAYNANQIFRDPAWRKKDPFGSLRIHSKDAEKLGIVEDDIILCKSEKAAIKVQVTIDDGMLLGYVSLPHGYGFDYTDTTNKIQQDGPKINILTSSSHCDPIAKTPYHKYVPVNLSKI